MIQFTKYQERNRLMLKTDGHTKQLGIIGYPVEHSFSPQMHNFISELTENNYIYSAWCVHPDNLGAAIDGIRALGIAGVNVTAPHKIEVMKYLDEISEDAKILGSVNTVVNRAGKLCGYNTDSDGFCAAVLNSGTEISGKNILVFGAGGVVRPTLIRLIKENPASITVLNRTKEKAQSLAERIKADTGFEILTDFGEKKYDIAINTTSAGMEPQLDALPIDAIDGIDDLSFIDSSVTVVDMIYNPSETLFLKKSKKRGAKTLNGLGMLIYQGIIAYELFTGTKLPNNIANRIAKEVFGR